MVYRNKSSQVESSRDRLSNCTDGRGIQLTSVFSGLCKFSAMSQVVILLTVAIVALIVIMVALCNREDHYIFAL